MSRLLTTIAHWIIARPMVAVTIAAGGIRAIRLANYQGLNGDEGFTLALAQRPFAEMVRLFQYEGNGVLYPLALWPLVRLEESVILLRLPALIAGTAAVAALYWTGLRFVGRRAALLAATLLAISPLAISYSQLARPYEFALLFVIVSFGCLDRAISDSRRRWWVGYVIATAAMGYSSALALIVLLPQTVLVLAYRTALRRWLKALALVAVCLVPLVVLLAWERTHRDPLYWLDSPTWANLVNVTTRFAASRYGVVIALLLFVLALPAMVRSDRLTRLRLSTVIAWAVIPLGVLFVVSQLEPVFWVGYTLPALPGVLLLVAACATRAPKVFAVPALLALVALSLRASVLHAERFHTTGWESAMRSLGSQRQPSDPVLFDIPDGLLPAGYYDPAFAAPNGHLVVSEWGDAELPPSTYLLDDPGGYGHAPIGPPSRRLLARLTLKSDSVFVMLYEVNRQGDIDDSPGFQWAHAVCDIERETFGDDLELVRITDCDR